MKTMKFQPPRYNYMFYIIVGLNIFIVIYYNGIGHKFYSLCSPLSIVVKHHGRISNILLHDLFSYYN